MPVLCEAINQPAQPALTIRTRTSVQNLPQTLGQGYQAIIEHLAHLGEQPAGPPFVAYYNLDMEDLDMELGFTTASKLEGTGDILSTEIPGGLYATCIFTGPYPEMASAYETLTAWTTDNGYQATGVVYEFYLNDPGETPAEALKTQILFALRNSPENL